MSTLGQGGADDSTRCRDVFMSKSRKRAKNLQESQTKSIDLLLVALGENKVAKSLKSR